jgi:hypothetical protein
MMNKLLVISLLWLAPAGLAAQRMGSVHVSGRSFSHFASRVNRGGYGRAAAYRVPFFDGFYSDDGGGPEDTAVPEPAMMYMRPSPSGTVRENPGPSAPLLIELQGDRYVQVSGSEVSPAQMIDRMPPNSASNTNGAGLKPPAQAETTLLVFRDGHREEISAYTIAGGMLYASADYYSSGTWNQTIALAALDLRETVRANQTRGVLFRVPAAANEVVVGP